MYQQQAKEQDLQIGWMELQSLTQAQPQDSSEPLACWAGVLAQDWVWGYGFGWPCDWPTGGAHLWLGGGALQHEAWRWQSQWEARHSLGTPLIEDDPWPRLQSITTVMVPYQRGKDK